MKRRPLPSAGSVGPVPPPRRYYETLRPPTDRPAALRCLRLAVPQRPLVIFAPRRTSAPPKPGVGDPVSPSGTSLRKRQDLPSSWGTPIVRLHMFHTYACRTADTRPYGVATWPLVIERQRLLQGVFRRSVAWLSDSLFTLRSAGCPAPRKTRFRPLVRRYRTGFPPARSQ